MSLRQLLPVLDVMGAANKHLARVGRFLQKYGDMDLFPVKLQVRLSRQPVLWAASIVGTWEEQYGDMDPIPRQAAGALPPLRLIRHDGPVKRTWDNAGGDMDADMASRYPA